MTIIIVKKKFPKQNLNDRVGAPSPKMEIVLYMDSAQLKAQHYNLYMSVDLKTEAI